MAGRALAALARAIRWGDGEALFELFTRTRAIRRGVIEAGQAYDREPAAGTATAAIAATAATRVEPG